MKVAGVAACVADTRQAWSKMSDIDACRVDDEPIVSGFIRRGVPSGELRAPDVGSSNLLVLQWLNVRCWYRPGGHKNAAAPACTGVEGATLRFATAAIGGGTGAAWSARR